MSSDDRSTLPAVLSKPFSINPTTEIIQTLRLFQARGRDGKQFVGVFIDQGLFGEPITAPHVRINAVNAAVVKVSRQPPPPPQLTSLIEVRLRSS